jgi:hypothetical protein
MKLCDVVQAIVVRENISAKDIEDTIYFLAQSRILEDVRAFRRIVKQMNKKLEYEDAPV